MIAIYLGVRTLVVGRGGVTVHRHTRAKLDTTVAPVGFARLKSQPPKDAVESSHSLT